MEHLRLGLSEHQALPTKRLDLLELVKDVLAALGLLVLDENDLRALIFPAGAEELLQERNPVLKGCLLRRHIEDLIVITS